MITPPFNILAKPALIWKSSPLSTVPLTGNPDMFDVLILRRIEKLLVVSFLFAVVKLSRDEAGYKRDTIWWG
jgi:hypothetical protein